MYFALDPIDTAIFIPTLRQALHANHDSAAAAPAMYYLALVDSAFDHGLSPLKWTSAPVPVYSATGRLGDLSDVSPKLLLLSQPTRFEFEIEVRQLLKHCEGRPMLSFLQSQVSPEKSCEHWQQCLMLKTTDGSAPYLLRFADTRVLPALQTMPGSTLWNILTQSVSQWFIGARTGAIQRLDLAKIAPTTLANDGSPDGDATDIELTDKDLTHLLREGQPDSVINAIAEHFPELLPERKHAIFYSHVAQVCALAQHQLCG